MSQGQSFGYWLKLKRKSLDFTQEGLADRVGCSAATIRKLEAEERRPSDQIVERLADIFSIPAAERPAFLRFARGNPQFIPDRSVEEVPWRASNTASRTNLPASLTSLIGREHDMILVGRYLADPAIRLVTLIGPPGIGKTRLSLELARTMLPDFLDGVFFVALASLTDPSLVAPAIQQALGYVESKTLSVDEQLIDSIGEKQILLVLDNCEHMVNEIARIISRLLRACPRLNILVTSREALRIPGEWLYTVPALDLPREDLLLDLHISGQSPALALFAERARAVRSDFALNAGNIRTVAAICQRLDGLPLAIELIAARVRLMSPQALLERMSDQFVLFADGMRADSARQKTLYNAIGWSFNLLTPDEQRLFAGLSVFTGGFTLETAEAVFSRTTQRQSVSDLITSLLDKSLLQRIVVMGGEIRFSMLVTIQHFALNHLRRLGIEAETRDRHLACFLELAEQGDREIRGPNQVEWGERLESELGNFRAALEWGVSTHKTESVLRLLCALGWPWEVRGHYEEARNWLEKARRLPELDCYLAIYASLLNHIGRHSWTQSHSQEARSLLEESRAISEKLGAQGEPVLAEALLWLGLVMLYHGNDSDSAHSMFRQSLELYQKWNNPRGIALATFHLGIVDSDAKRNETALRLFEKSLALFQQFSDLFFIARVSGYLGYLFLDQGDLDKARQYMEQQLQIDQEIQFWDGIADGWRNLGNLYRHQGMFDQASRCYEKGIKVCWEHGLNKPDVLANISQAGKTG